MQAKPQDIVAVETLDLLLHQVTGKPPCVVDAPTANATHVVVPVQVAIEPRLRAADFQLPDYAHLYEEFQVSVYRGQADFGQATPRHLV